MNMWKLLMLVNLFLLTACTGLIQSTSISEAYKKFEAQDFKQTLELISRAENFKETTPEMKAELTYLKANSYESLGQKTIANALYEYLVKEHKGSQYSYLARKKLNENL